MTRTELLNPKSNRDQRDDVTSSDDDRTNGQRHIERRYMTIKEAPNLQLIINTYFDNTSKIKVKFD